MIPTDNRAIDAIWKTDMDNAQEKLVLYQLASKHELGERYSSNWKSLENFIADFQPRFAPFKELENGTQLSTIKLQRTIEGLLKKGYIEAQSREEVAHAGDEWDARVFAITPKIFKEYRQVLQKQAKTRQA